MRTNFKRLYQIELRRLLFFLVRKNCASRRRMEHSEPLILISSFCMLQKKTQKNKTRNILCYNLLIDFGFVNFSSRFWSFFLFLHFALCDRLAHYNQDFHMHVCVNISIESTSLLIVIADASAVPANIFCSSFKWKRNSSHRYTACNFEIHYSKCNKNQNDKLKLWIYAKCMNWESFCASHVWIITRTRVILNALMKMLM